jgi:hypothetical protein
MDFGRHPDAVTDAQAAAIHEAYPRLAMVRSLVDAIVEQARTRPDKAPRYSIAGELLRERSTPPHRGLTRTQTTRSQYDCQLSTDDSSRWAGDSRLDRTRDLRHESASPGWLFSVSRVAWWLSGHGG